MRLHVDLFIKYVSNNGQFYIDITNNWQRKLLVKLKSILSSMFKLRWSLGGARPGGMSYSHVHVYHVIIWTRFDTLFEVGSIFDRAF